MGGPGATAAPARRWRIAIALVCAFALVVCGLFAWALASESGLRALVRLVGHTSGGSVTVGEVRGRLFGPLEIDEVRVDAPGLGVEIRTLSLDWRLAALFTDRLEIGHLSVGEIVVNTVAGDAAPAALQLPAQLQLPLALNVHRLEIGRLVLRSLPAGETDRADTGSDVEIRNLVLSGESDRGRHRVLELAADLAFGHVRLDAELDTTAPYALALRGVLAGRIDPDRLPEGAVLAPDALDYRIEFDGSGVLAEPVLNLRASGAGLAGEARVIATPFATIPLKALELSLDEFNPALFAPAAPHAALRLEASLQASEVNGLTLGGPVRIANAEPRTLDAGGLPLQSFAGELSWSEREGGVEGLELRLPGGGRIGGRLGWTRPAAGTGSPPDFTSQTPSTVYPPGWPAWPAGLGQLHLELSLEGIDPSRLDARLPGQIVDGRIDADGEAQRQRVSLKLAAGAARVEAEGEMTTMGSDGGAAAARFALKGLLRHFDPREFHPDAPHARLNLDLDVNGAVAETPSLSATFALADSRLEGRPLSGSGSLKLVGERLSDVVLRLDVAGNRLRADGNWGRAGDRLELDVDAPALGALGLELEGRAAINGIVGGSFAAPTGSLRFSADKLRLPGAVVLGQLRGEARLDAGFDGPFAVRMEVSALGAAGASDAWADSARLVIDGRRERHRIEINAVRAEDRVQLVLDGGLLVEAGKPPRWQGELRELETAGIMVARLQAPAALILAADEMRLAPAELNAGEQGRIRLLETAWSPVHSVLRGSLTGLTFGLVTRADGRPRRGPGPLVLGAEWDVRVADTIEGEARLFRESGDLTVSGEIRTRLGLEQFESRLVARGNRLALSFGARGSELGELSGALTAEAERSEEGGWRLASQKPLLGSARISMPSVAWIGRLMRENIETGGQLEGNFSVAGTPADPLASGRITGTGLQLALVDQGLILSGGELVADFDRDQVRLARLHFISPNRVRPRDNRVPFAALTATPGELTASGAIALDTGLGAFEFEALRLPLLQRTDRWLILSGKGHARSSWTTLEIDADLRADAGYFAIDDTPPPSLSEDVVILGAEEPVASDFGISARIGVDLGDALYLSAMGVDTRLTGVLALRLTPGVPLTAVGSISTVGGTYLGYGQRLSIERGLINFQGELDNPGLNIVTLRKGLEVEAGVAITGSARRPQVRLVSEPGVPDPEKLSWIVLGRAPDAGGGADLALLLPAAQALLGRSGGGMTEELSRSLGFDSFSIGQGELNSSARTATSRVVGSGSRISSGPTVAGQVLSVGRRISSDLLLSFEQSLGGAESLVKLTYQLGRRVSMVARGGTDNALDIYYTFSFR